jgi:sec-independent protein translocase protein TatA
MPKIGVPELIIVLVILLLLFGAGRLSKIGQSLGQGIREFRGALRSGENQENAEEEEAA